MKLKEKILIKIAWLVPPRLALWVFIRVYSFASSGKYGNETVDSITYQKAYDRWVEKYKIKE